jgi:transposase
MTRAYSIAFKQKLIERLTGKEALSATKLGRESGVPQQNLSRWLREARSLPSVASHSPKTRVWSVEQKAQVLADALKLSGEELTSHLERAGIKLADFERWRIALEDDGGGSAAALKRIRALERELARKEKALAEAAVLLVLKKTIDSYYKEEDDDTDEPSEKSS